MTILIGYAPLPSEKGVPLLSQNRQFQWFSKPTFVYPMVPASAATLMKTLGHDVHWLDGIAEALTDDVFDVRYASMGADLFLLETKTPVVKATWRVVDRLKARVPGCLIVLCGDHVTALPEESLRNCQVDYVLCGGDYDFSLRDLVAHIERGASMPKGIWWRGADGELCTSGPFDLSKNRLDDLPMIDRDLTRWELYSRENGNFRNTRVRIRWPGATAGGGSAIFAPGRHCIQVGVFVHRRACSMKSGRSSFDME